MNFIVTAFNDDYWNPHGISWIASLCEFSKTSATPVVLNLGLNEKIVNIVKDVEHATGEQEWKFVGMDGFRKELDITNLNQEIVQDPKLYALPPESREYYLRMKNLTKY